MYVRFVLCTWYIAGVLRKTKKSPKIICDIVPLIREVIDKRNDYVVVFTSNSCEVAKKMTESRMSCKWAVSKILLDLIISKMEKKSKYNQYGKLCT